MNDPDDFVTGMRVLGAAAGAMAVLICLSAITGHCAERAYDVTYQVGDVVKSTTIRVWAQPRCYPYTGCMAGWSETCGQLHGRKTAKRGWFLSPIYQPGYDYLCYLYDGDSAGWVMAIDPRPDEDGSPVIAVRTYWHPATYTRRR